MTHTQPADDSMAGATAIRASNEQALLQRFVHQLAARGGEARCYWHRALWPAEDAGLIRATYVPVQMPRHRTRPIRQWCYQVTLTDAGWSMASRTGASEDAIEKAERDEAPGQGDPS